MDQRLGRHADDKEVSAYVKISSAQLRQELIEIGPATLSFLEGLGGTEPGGPWEDFLKDPRGVKPEAQAHKGELVGMLSNSIEKLPAQERRVLTLLIYEEMGQKEIAEVLGVTPSRVSQIHAKAIIRLRSAMAPATQPG